MFNLNRKKTQSHLDDFCVYAFSRSSLEINQVTDPIPAPTPSTTVALPALLLVCWFYASPTSYPCYFYRQSDTGYQRQCAESKRG